MGRVIKQPGESRLYDLPMGLSDGRSIASVDAVTITAKGLVAEVTALSEAVNAFAGQVVQLRVFGGTDGEVYLITASVTDDQGDTVEADTELHVLDLTFAVPADGQATTYIEPSDYVARYGLEETITLTDEDGVGKVDKPVLNAALADTAAEIDGHLAVRYETPIDPVPALVRTIAGDLTRERLHGVNVPEAVKGRAAAARRNLASLAAGKMTLPGVAAISTGTTSAPSYSQGDNRPFSDGALDDY